MKEKLKKVLYRMNFKKTWPYFLADGLLFGICCIFCELIAYAVEHHEELSFLDDEFLYGLTNFQVVFFVWGFFIVYLLCRLIECLFKYFSDCISKHRRKDD